MLEVHKTNNNNNGINKALNNINNLKEEYINIYKNVYCKDESGRTLPNTNTNNCKTKKQLNKINSYFTNKNVTENNNGNEHNNSYNNETFLKNINKYKQLGLRINNSSKVKVYRSVYNKELKKFTETHKTKLFKLDCLLTILKELEMAKKSSTKLLAYKTNNNINFTNLQKFKTKHTQYKQQTQKQRKQKLSKFFSKLNPFGKKVNGNQSTQLSATAIEYNKKEHKELKKTISNKVRLNKIKKFSEDINQLFPNNI